MRAPGFLLVFIGKCQVHIATIEGASSAVTTWSGAFTEHYP